MPPSTAASPTGSHVAEQSLPSTGSHTMRIAVGRGTSPGAASATEAAPCWPGGAGYSTSGVSTWGLQGAGSGASSASQVESEPEGCSKQLALSTTGALPQSRALALAVAAAGARGGRRSAGRRSLSSAAGARQEACCCSCTCVAGPPVAGPAGAEEQGEEDTSDDHPHGECGRKHSAELGKTTLQPTVRSRNKRLAGLRRAAVARCACARSWESDVFTTHGAWDAGLREAVLCRATRRFRH